MTTNTAPVHTIIRMVAGPMCGMAATVVAIPMGDPDFRTVRFADGTSMIVGCDFFEVIS